MIDFSNASFPLSFDVDADGRVMMTRLGAEDPRPKRAKWCPLVEVQISGENPDDHHGAKHTGTWGARTLRYASHKVVDTKNGQRIEILLTNDKIEVTVFYQLYHGIAAMRAWTSVKNRTNEPVGLEYVSSFSFTGVDAGLLPANEKMTVYLPHNAWVREVDWRSYTLSQLGLEHISKFATGRIAVSNSGTWSSKEKLPMGALRNAEVDNTLLWQIEHNGSWHWELSDIDDMLYLKLSGPTEQENQWYKELKPGEGFESVRVALALGASFDDALAQMTAYRRVLFCNNSPNAALPVIFNDYMNCLWADPTEEKELPLIERAAEAGAEYYCMDAGWYANGTWWETVGEWQPYEGRFPNGIKRVFDYIREKGMVPGIWLEIEVMGIDCPLVKEWEDECFFMRHGKRVIDHGRYQLDFRHPKVRAHASAVVDRVVREYGVGYIKMDYNIEAGLGTEVNADSFGDGLLEHNRAYLAWLDEILAKYPDLIWENCSSGGMRMEYAMLQRAHVQSVSDQSNYKKMAPIAAAAPTAVLPEQSAIWSYPRAEDDLTAVTFNMVSSMLQRIHLSGALLELSDEAFAAVREGVAVYKTLRGEIARATPFYPIGLPDYNADWLCLGLKTEKCTLLAVWHREDGAEALDIPLSGKVRVLYGSECEASVAGDHLCVELSKPYSAAILSVEMD